MPNQQLHVVTGAFGYSGKYIAARLLDIGHRVRTLTASPQRPNPFLGQVQAYPFHWDEPERLAASLEGCAVLYNNYWVRFGTKTATHAQAVRNTLTLFEAAGKAGVGRIVHVSITNPSEESSLPYFRGKALLERALKESGMSYAILRPAVLFGHEDILINNIAYMLRRLPVFGVFGDGGYRLRPIHVEDFAKLAVEQGQARENVTIDAVGPETFTYRELVEAIGSAIGKRRPVVSVPPWAGYLFAWAMGKVLGDVVLTREEVQGLMDGLVCTEGPTAGSTRLTDWARQNAASLGRRYASELARRRNREKAYGGL
jgi:NADH dehydrogenase